MDALVNLIEYAKGLDDPLAGGMIQQFAETSDVLAMTPFKNAPQGLNRFFRETSEAQVDFRAINETPDISHGSEEAFQDSCYPISGLLEWDRIKRIRYGDSKQSTYMAGQMKNAARVWTDTFINGDNDSDPRLWNGLKKRLLTDANGVVDGTSDDSRLMVNSSVSGGEPLSLAKLDVAVSLVNEPTHILMSRDLKVKFQAAARNPNLTNNRISEDMDSDLGRRVMRFGDTPILFGYQPSKGNAFLPYNEVAFGGGSAVTTSIYVVSYREDGLCGIQTASPEYVPVDTDKGVFERSLFEWDNGITQEDFYAAMRLSSIANAPIVA